MANICTNITAIHCPDSKVLEQILNYIKENFDCYTSVEADDCMCELEFSSRNSFPLEEMKEMTSKISNKNLHIQVITYEFPNDILEYHVFQNNQWIDKLNNEEI